MAQITDISSLINNMTGGGSGTPELLMAYKTKLVAGAAAVTDYYHTRRSLWRFEGNPGTGAIPTAAAVPTSATAGAIPFTNPSGGREKWLVGVRVGQQSNKMGFLNIYDRLLHCGGLSGTVTTAQTVGGAITRNTGGVGNRIFVEQYVSLGTTVRTVTASYTNQDGTAGRTTQSHPIGGSIFSYKESRHVGPENFIELPLQSGDTGVRSVQSVTLSGSTGAAGNFGITIGKPLVRGLDLIGLHAELDLTVGLNGPIKIDDNACLAMWAHSRSVGVLPNLAVSLSTVEV